MSAQLCDRLLVSRPQRVRHHRGPRLRGGGRERPLLPRDRRRDLVQHRVHLQVKLNIFWVKVIFFSHVPSTAEC